ncbi:hypothetical protein LEP1GSC083_5475 [Leptospira interrogans serovar Pyrogenes str. L0374]|uniref:Uncharacterized protein n=1 Tax=Leptospira interrogans serovar Pyrogenes str. L0374 TaxID=1049928 RepID=M6KLL7_LEPIR|nr:hypothetical protein LEP1GSC083_5475 [Leptospira interrogans serovar Pyrogenes str. L0374]
MLQNFLKINGILFILIISLGIFLLECFKTEQRSLEVSIAIPGNDKEKSLIINESSDKISFHVLVKTFPIKKFVFGRTGIVGVMIIYLFKYKPIKKV